MYAYYVSRYVSCESFSARVSEKDSCMYVLYVCMYTAVASRSLAPQSRSLMRLATPLIRLYTFPGGEPMIRAHTAFLAILMLLKDPKI